MQSTQYTHVVYNGINVILKLTTYTPCNVAAVDISARHQERL